MRLKPCAIGIEVVECAGTGHTPITPPVSATARACRPDQAAARARMSCQRGMRDDTNGFVVTDAARFHEIERAVRNVHHNTQFIAAAHDIRAEIGQAAVEQAPPFECRRVRSHGNASIEGDGG